MKAGAPLKRTPMKRAAPMARTTKPATGKPKLRKCGNRACRAPYTPDPKHPFITWCSGDCAVVIGMERVAKMKAARAKAERAADKVAKKQATSPAKLADPVRKLAQRYAVLRDRDYGCISCDKGAHWHGVWHGSHFKSVGSNSALQFNLWNINKSCDQCNFFLAGNIGPYETRLRQKYGDERVDWLKNHPRSREYTPEYLDRLARILRKKIRRLEKRLGIK
jgi:hypothetical protein